MPDRSSREVLEEWRGLMESALSTAASAAGRPDLPRELLGAMQGQMAQMQRVVDRERLLGSELAARILGPVDAVFDLLEESGATLRTEAEALESAGRALQETAGLMKRQAELFEQTIGALREPAELAKVAAGLARRPGASSGAKRSAAAKRPGAATKRRSGATITAERDETPRRRGQAAVARRETVASVVGSALGEPLRSPRTAVDEGSRTWRRSRDPARSGCRRRCFATLASRTGTSLATAPMFVSRRIGLSRPAPAVTTQGRPA